ncbi:MAG: hypothetical protein NC319_03565 [Butyricicoccus sp.]|nr:hypothetical protein [Butyricicoccus sp.]
MSHEAIAAITGTEEKVRQMKADALAEAKRSVAQAQALGEEAIASAIKKADAEIAELMKKAEEKATADASELAQSNENRKAAMRARADVRLDKAAELIVERIVNS